MRDTEQSGIQTTVIKQKNKYNTARKSKGKFTMKGYSPFKKEDETKLNFADIEITDKDANKAKSQAEGQSGVSYGLQELISMRNRLKAKKQKIENPSKTLEEQKNKYNVSLDDGLNEDSAINKPIQKFDPLAKDKIKYGNTDRISNLKIK